MDRNKLIEKRTNIELEMKNILMAAFAIHQPRMAELQTELFALQDECTHEYDDDGTSVFTMGDTCPFCGKSKTQL